MPLDAMLAVLRPPSALDEGLDALLADPGRDLTTP
jgi:hypothetical protein